MANGDKNRTYDYDGIGRLKTAKGGVTGTLWTQTYTYDRLGNRTNVVATGNAAGTGGAMPVDGLPTTANYESASNRLTSIVPNASTGINPANPNFDYDPAGNQTRVIQSNGVAQRYCYDAAGRLAQVKSDNNTTMVASYGYGASNQRLKQTEYDSNGVAMPSICYAWFGSSIIGEYLDNGSLVWQKCYVYLGGRLLSTQVPGTATNATQFHHPDRLGTRIISNAGDTGYSENAVLPYGTAIDAESAGTTTNRRFTSYDRSSVTKLDYAVNRFYDCKQGRFTQVDPIGMSAVDIGDPQSLNLYAYCGNDPINNTDPEGLFWKQLFGWVGKILKVVAIAVFIAGAILLTAGLAAAAIGGAWAAGGVFWDAFSTLMEGVLAVLGGQPTSMIIQFFGASASSSALGGFIANWTFIGIGSISNFVQQKASSQSSTRRTTGDVKRDFYKLYGLKLNNCIKKVFGKDAKKVGRQTLSNAPALNAKLNGKQVGAISKVSTAVGSSKPSKGTYGAVYIASGVFNANTSNTLNAIYGTYAHEVGNILDIKTNPNASQAQYGRTYGNPKDSVDTDTGAAIERCIFGSLQYP